MKKQETLQTMLTRLKTYEGPVVKIMQVCGSHTISIMKYGIKQLLSPNIQLLSGPGCPVCVTTSSYLEDAIYLSHKEEVMVATFGDLMRVPVAGTSLQKEKAKGASIQTVYSPLDCLLLAKEYKNKKIVFLSIGFETTIPVIALTVQQAKKQGITNFYILSDNKTMPEVLAFLSSQKEVAIDGYLYPGHVSTIIGVHPYREIAKKYYIPGVVAGFEAVDMIIAIDELVKQIIMQQIQVENRYQRAVKEGGNLTAQSAMKEVFEKTDGFWRGIGKIQNSGLCFKDKYKAYDARQLFQLQRKREKKDSVCQCGEILIGKSTPLDCILFGKECTPQNPIGACMVSTEGTCYIYHQYKKKGG